jgi:dTDP-4-amino-4,6-dideoxygalactose transaminase
MIDPKSAEALITPKTRAIVVLHKDGDLAEMDELLAIGKKYNIKIIEDAAHAFGAKYKDRTVGTMGDYTCFSLQAVKQVTTGDGGFLTVKTEEDFLLAKRLKWFGMDKEVLPPGVGPYEVDISVLGYKGNINDIAATIGVEQMKFAPEILAKYHKNGRRYSELLKDVSGVELLPRSDENYETFWTYVALVDNRDKVVAALKEEGIASGIIHPRNDKYSVFGKYKKDLLGVDAFVAREISLPCGWWVEDEDIQRIVEVIKKNSVYFV